MKYSNKLSEKKLVCKVLMVNTVPMIYDGIGMTILNYASNLDKTDMQVDFVVINHLEDKMRDQIEEMRARIYELTERNTSQVKYVMALAKVVKEGNYDIVHVHCNSCTAAVDLLGAKLGGAKMLCPHSHNTKCVHTGAHKLLRPLFNFLYTDGFACGELAGQWLYPGKQFTVLKNATNTDNYRFDLDERERIRKQYHLEGKVAVGHVAHFTLHKNHPFLINVFADVVKQNPNYVLFLIGDGKYKEDIMSKVKDMSIAENVVFVGTTLDIPAYLCAMDMMVLPSLWEGLPNVVIEWQVAGLPTLVADTVTTDCKLTESVSFISLEKGAWVEAIFNANFKIDRKVQSEKNIKEIAAAGYSIKEQAAKLKQYYVEHLKK